MRLKHPYKQYLGKWLTIDTPDEEGNKYLVVKMRMIHTTPGRAMGDHPETVFKTVELYATGEVEWSDFYPERGQHPMDPEKDIVKPTHRDLKRLFNWIFKGMKHEV